MPEFLKFYATLHAQFSLKLKLMEAKKSTDTEVPALGC